MISFRSVRRLPVLCGFAFAVLLTAATIPPADVEIAGSIEYGQTSPPVEYTPSPKFRALVFSAEGGDRIEVTVRAGEGKALIAIADGALRQLAAGEGRLVFEIPDRGPDAEAYYILFRDADAKPRRFTVSLRKIG